jgi:hypothetical protein
LKQEEIVSGSVEEGLGGFIKPRAPVAGVEKMRNEAEHAAAKARSIARRLGE